MTTEKPREFYRHISVTIIVIYPAHTSCQQVYMTTHPQVFMTPSHYQVVHNYAHVSRYWDHVHVFRSPARMHLQFRQLAPIVGMSVAATWTRNLRPRNTTHKYMGNSLTWAGTALGWRSLIQPPVPFCSVPFWCWQRKMITNDNYDRWDNCGWRRTHIAGVC